MHIFLYSTRSLLILAQAAHAAFGPVEVSPASHFDVSGPLSQLTGSALVGTEGFTVNPLHVLPNILNVVDQVDTAVQTTPGPLVGAPIGLNFPGVGNGDYNFEVTTIPPDTVGAVGATQYVQWVNNAIAVFDKTTGVIAANFPKPGNSIWQGFGGGCETRNDGDPIVQYDKIAQRWVLTQFTSKPPYLQCVAVSKTSDATGTYNRYSFDYGNTQLHDYPKLGVWPDGYYISYNLFHRDSNDKEVFDGSKICAWDRAKMLVGDPTATQHCFPPNPNDPSFSLLPSDLDGTTTPPNGSPNFLVSLGNNSLNLWKFTVDFANTAANTALMGPITVTGVAAFNVACPGDPCIPQPNTDQLLDSLGDRLMYRLAYRNIGGVESLLVNHSVSVNGITSVRWYEIRNPNGTPTIFQQGTLGVNDSIHRWMGSIAMDKQGNIALGYSASSESIQPSIRYTGRLVTDALGSMQTENIIQAGGGSQIGGNHSRWGDYTAMTVDPVDDCTFWYTNEYLKSDGSFVWSTKVASFRFPGCMSTTNTPTVTPTNTPTIKPTNTPTIKPTNTPTMKPTNTPTMKPNNTPTMKPISTPTMKPIAFSSKAEKMPKSGKGSKSSAELELV